MTNASKEAVNNLKDGIRIGEKKTKRKTENLSPQKCMQNGIKWMGGRMAGGPRLISREMREERRCQRKGPDRALRPGLPAVRSARARTGQNTNITRNLFSGGEKK